MEDPQIFRQLLHPQPPAGTYIHSFHEKINTFITNSNFFFSAGLLVRPLKNPALEMRNRPLALQLQQHRQPRNFVLLLKNLQIWNYKAKLYQDLSRILQIAIPLIGMYFLQSTSPIYAKYLALKVFF